MKIKLLFLLSCMSASVYAMQDPDEATVSESSKRQLDEETVVQKAVARARKHPAAK